MKRRLLICALVLSFGVSAPMAAYAAASTSEPTAQATKTATGIVLDNQGEPLIGATVVVAGTSKGVSTGIDGDFSIPNVELGAKLQVSFVGFVPVTIEFKGEPLTINMKVDAQSIDEVIVVGYTTQQRNAVTGSIATVKAEKLKDQSTANVASMLQGKVSGVNVSTPSGKPGETAKITIRGKGSISSSLDPIWVVDGVIWNQDPRLSPQEIESISILKDASATALYGSRASNGVIVISTNKGKAGQQSFNVAVNVGVKSLDLGNLDLMNSQQLYDFHKPFNTVSWFTEDLLKHDTDWFKMATQNGVYTNASFTYTGGTEKIQSYLLLDYYRETASIKDMNFQRFTIRSNNDYKWADNFTAFTKIQTQYEKQKDQSASLYDTYLYLPWDYPTNPDGTMRTGKEADWYGRDKRNYMHDQFMDLSRKERIYVSATAGFKWSFTDYLSFESNNNVNMFLERADSYTDPRSTGGEATNGQVYNWYQLRENFFTNQMLRFNKSFGKHSVQALAAYEYTRQLDQVTNVTAKGVTPGKEVIDGTTGMVSMKGYKKAFNIQSVLVNANYSYDSRYMFQASYRLDGSSKFGQNNQYGSFYTVSGAWNISSEKFWDSAKDVMDMFKLRASWGVVGNTPNDNYNHYTLYTAGQYDSNPANFPSQLGNPNLTWEKNQTTNVAIDMSFLGRIRATVEFYNKATTDLLYNVQLATITGYSSQWQNIGALNNKGIEISANADIISTEDWLWNVDFNIGFNKNKVIALYENRPQISGIRRFEVGRDMDELYLGEWAGVNPETGAPQWYTNDKDGKRVLTGSYNASQGNNRTYIGSAAPKFLGGFGTMVSWKNLSLNANFAYSVGGKMYSQNREVIDADGAYLDYNAMVLAKGWNRWEKPGDIATHPKAISGGNNMSNKVSSRYVEDASYLTMRNINLTYQLPASALKKIGLKGLSISLNADNLFTVTDYSLISPDVASYSSDGYAAWGQYPMTRSYIIGLNVRF